VTNYIIRRLLQMIPTVLLSTLFVFLMLNLVRGDAIDLYFGMSEDRTPQAEQALRRQLGIDRPLAEQYLIWLSHIARGDLGESWRFKIPVSSLVGQRIFLSLELFMVAALISIFGSITLGIYLASHQNSFIDQLVRFLSLILLSAPLYWLAILIVVLLSRTFRWVPPIGYVSLFQDPLKHLQIIAIPAILWGLTSIPSFSRFVRNTILDVLSSDYIRTARAKGATRQRVLYKHALRNAAGPLATVVGLSLAGAVGGSVLMEAVFNLPGMGRLWLEGIFQRDYPLVMGISILISTSFVVVNFLTDLSYAVFDPRIRYE
jgi:peptide/nickel transport system permease protein